MSFKDLCNLGVARARMKVANDEADYQPSWTDRAVRAAATGVGAGLGHLGGAAASQLLPHSWINSTGKAIGFGVAGAGLGSAAGAGLGNYMVTHDPTAAGTAALGAGVGSLAGSGAAGLYASRAMKGLGEGGAFRVGSVAQGQPAEGQGYWNVPAAGALAAGALGGGAVLGGVAADMYDQSKHSNFMSPEEEESWAAQHPMAANALRAGATGLGGGLANWGANAALSRYAPQFGMDHRHLMAAGTGLATGLGAAGANYLAGGDGMSAGISGLGAGLGAVGAEYGANAGMRGARGLQPSADMNAEQIQNRMNWANRGAEAARYGAGGAIGGAAASAATDAVRGRRKKDNEKRSYDDMEGQEDPSMFQRIGRNVATGAGGALGSWGTNALMGRFAPGFMSRNPNWSNAVNAAGTGLSAAGANYAAGGDALSAGVSGLGAAGGMYALHHGGMGYLNAKQKQIDAGKIDAAGHAALMNRANTLGNLDRYGAGAAAGGMLTDAAMQGMGY